MNRDVLLDSIAESPNDDGPRLVYADWLLQQASEAERARGEYIALACSTTRSTRRTARMKELMTRYEDGWLGAVAPMIDRRREWARGFLEACAFNRNHHPLSIADAMGHEAWRTVRTFVMTGWEGDRPIELLRQRELSNLRSLYVYQSILGRLTDAAIVPRVSELAVDSSGQNLADLITLLDAPCFERLRKLHVFGCSAALGCSFERRGLTLIAVAGPDALAGWLAELDRRRPTLDEVRLVSSVFTLMARQGVELVIRPAEDGRWSALEVRWTDREESRLRDRVIFAMGQLPEGVITRLSFVGPATKRFDVARWKQRIVGALQPRQPELQIG